MANPRQRRKARSSSHRAVKTSRNPKSLKKHAPIRGPKVLQEAWDNHKTVRQNYAALGLAHSLSPCVSGGREAGRDEDSGPRHESIGSSRREGEGPGGNGEIGEGGADDRIGAAGRIPAGFGRIVRDGEGRVVGVELEEERTDVVPRHLMEAGQPERTALGVLGQSSEENEVIQALEKRAEEKNLTRTRTVSDAEVKYLRELVRAHGDDVEKMSRDLKRNAMQYTAGQLRRAILSAGGYERLGLGHSS